MADDEIAAGPLNSFNPKRPTPPSSGHGGSSKHKIRKKSNSTKSDFASNSSITGSSKLGGPSDQEKGDNAATISIVPTEIKQSNSATTAPTSNS